MKPISHDDTTDPVIELLLSLHRGRELAAQSRTDLENATPVIIEAIRHHSGQSRKIESILWSLWNDDYAVNLCDALAGLDAKLAQATLAMISCRAYCGGVADDQLKKIIEMSGSQPPPPPFSN